LVSSLYYRLTEPQHRPAWDKKLRQQHEIETQQEKHDRTWDLSAV